jgi:CheY-like chemotaxis protein
MAAYDLAEYGLKNDGIAATRDLAPALPNISADSDQLHQIIINLIVNAQQALVEMGAADRALTLRTAIGETHDTVILEVADNGPGIPDEARRRVFEPFYTTKPQGQGTGVGLSFSQGLAEAHGGRLDLMPTPRGACFRLTLPIDPDQAATAVPAQAAATGELPLRRALVIDDEREIAESLADFLSFEGFNCDIAAGGAEAQARLAVGDYDLIVSDLRMPGIDGPALHTWIAAERPDLLSRVAFATGDTLGAAAARFLDEVKRPVLEKPFTPDAVHLFLQQMDLA